VGLGGLEPPRVVKKLAPVTAFSNNPLLSARR